MTSESLPEEWEAPVWHEDYGDPRIELEHLRSVAIVLRSAIPGVRLELEQPEPGLMVLVIALSNQETVEVHSVANSSGAEGRRYAIFVSPETPYEVEHYSESVADALGFIRKRFIRIS